MIPLRAKRVLSSGRSHELRRRTKRTFDKLAQAIKENLTGVKVYKLGDEAEKQASIVGMTRDGNWARLKTTMVGT